jgi:peroxiredoxin
MVAAASGQDAMTGRSEHGPAFDSGPRRAAEKLNGSGVVNFPISTKSREAQAFITQGVGLLHGFWYYEAERSFRQAAAIDPDCAMAFWGMALANFDDNETRAKAFIAEAVKRKDKATPRERSYVEALDDYFRGANGDNKARRRALVAKYEEIARKNPDDLEAKAFLVWQLWDNQLRGGLPIDSKLAVNALVGQILASQPRHPAHHYRIHLTDHTDDAGGFASAAMCGPIAPAIPHMWHMPGHTYAANKRYADAAWQMEAAQRVENAHLTRMHMVPENDHLYGHNRGWLIDNLDYSGRVRDAIDLCKHVVDLPRHPGNNQHLEAGKKLFDILVRHERWEELLALEQSEYLPTTDDRLEQARRLVAFGRADLGREDRPAAVARLAKLNDWCDEARNEFVSTWANAFGPNHLAGVLGAMWSAGTNATPATFAVDYLAAERSLRRGETGAKADGIRGKIDRLRSLERACAELRGHIALANGAVKAAQDWFAQAGDVGADVRANLYASAGDAAKVDEATRDTDRRVFRLADRVDLLQRIGKTAEARAAFVDLRSLAGTADLDDPPLARLAPLAASYGWPRDWRTPTVQRDVGLRPPLESFGPLRWQPWPAAEWALPDADGRIVRSSDYRGKPVVVIFYLGFGCIHCVEQLTAFLPRARDFAAAGIDVVAIGTDSSEALKGADADGKYPFTVLSDKDYSAFRAFGAFDDFERIPLHATILIDAAGRVRWQDTGAEPFKDPDFLLTEAKRLLKIKPPSTTYLTPGQ